MIEQEINWTEEDSQVYQQLATIAVPARDEQIATIVALLPFGKDAEFSVVELGSGEGFLSEAILSCFPNARMLALDGSVAMRARASERLQRFESRFAVQSFNIEDPDWLQHARGVDAVVSSLCVHHLTSEGKQRMFNELARHLNPGGALVIADLVAAVQTNHHQLLGAQWDHETHAASTTASNGASGWQAFLDEKWNIYWWPDEMDRPSPLFEQLRWLSTAGFDPVDCFWLRGAHAIYGGFVPGVAGSTNLVGFEQALATSRSILGMET